MDENSLRGVMHAIRMFVFQQKKSDSNKLKNEKKRKEKKRKKL